MNLEDAGKTEYIEPVIKGRDPKFSGNNRVYENISH